MIIYDASRDCEFQTGPEALLDAASISSHINNMYNTISHGNSSKE